MNQNCQNATFNSDTESNQNISQVANISWVSEMLEKCQTTVQKTIYQWAYIATQLTDNFDDIKPWVQSFYDHFNETCSEYLTDMKDLEANFLVRIEKCLEDLQKLCSLLKVDIPCVGQKKLCLFQEHQQLKKYILEYEVLVNERKSKLEKLKKKEKHLCASLGKPPVVFGENLPSQNEIEEFEDYINKLETDKFTRLEKFTTIREEILKIIRELKYHPSGDFEIKVCYHEDTFLITDDNMESLEAFHQRLMKEWDDVSDETKHLRAEIEHLWNLLEIDLLEREQIRKNTYKNNLEVLEMLRAEKQRCEDMKKVNLKVFIDRLRNDLVNIWSQCHCTDDVVKNEFKFFYTDCYTEDLLELHENELKKWLKFYDENREILMLLEKHKNLWMKMLELDDNATGPNRYNNRGGQLLKEEKERNKLSKQIPQIERDLVKLGSQYEERTRSPFLTFGQTIEDYIINLHAERENVKKQKLSAKKQQRDIKLTPGASTYSASTAQVGSVTKRKIPFTPIPESGKKQKLIGSNGKDATKRKMNVPKIMVTCSTTKRYSLERKKRINKIRRSLSKRNEQTFSSDYGVFETDITNKVGCRSTLLPDSNTITCNTTFTSPTKATPKRTATVKRKTPLTGIKTPIAIRKTPLTGRKTPQTPRTGTQLSAARSNLKLLF